MGILNATPDSFYDKGKFFKNNLTIERGIQLSKNGADIIDIGGESTRPGAIPVGEDEELQRVIPLIKALKASIPTPLSIDTTKPRVAQKALEAGASWINDVSGFCHSEMQEIAASSKTQICVMHMQGTPNTMQKNPQYPNGIIEHIMHWFEKQINLLLKAGVQESQITLDPGIGFGKTILDNILILQSLKEFKSLGFPLLLGVSRKSFMGNILNKPSEELLASTISVNTLAIKEGIDIIRVHDVVEHRDIIDLCSHLLEEKSHLYATS